MMIVGLTGGIGSGKSTVADLFAKMGVAIIDTDIIAKALVGINKPAYLDIIKQFGDEILLPNRELDRALLKQRIINNSDERIALENILHPLIQEKVKAEVNTATGKYCVVVIPLLVEKANYPMLDRILVIDTSIEHQIARASQRDDLQRTDLKKLIAIQATREQRLAAANDVIDNTQGLAELATATQQIHDKYLTL